MFWFLFVKGFSFLSVLCSCSCRRLCSSFVGVCVVFLFEKVFLFL